ncbi:unnamed protein product [Lactuca virosa]|uniref:Uncharacterized protein n=1 Tax=Lactuca virosa TaxID=75947 RepID=A0AAU9MI15_9ASTR|nr:unnamed protein product [Lactuca virosa]
MRTFASLLSHEQKATSFPQTSNLQIQSKPVIITSSLRTFTTQSLHDYILFVKQIHIDISGRRFAAIIISSTSSVFSGRNPTVFPFSGFKFIKILVFNLECGSKIWFES